MKTFVLIKPDGQLSNLNANTPRDAALKAVTRLFENIVLVDHDKLYIYKGYRTKLMDDEKNDFMRDKNISYKSNVRKMCYQRLSFTFNAKNEEHKSSTKASVEEIIPGYFI
jgi:hypothetical protein